MMRGCGPDLGSGKVNIDKALINLYCVRQFRQRHKPPAQAGDVAIKPVLAGQVNQNTDAASASSGFWCFSQPYVQASNTSAASLR
jgi:hypothetical protein